MKAADDHELSNTERLSAQSLIDLKVADAGVNPNRHVQPACFFVERKEIRIVQGVMGLDPADEHGARTIAVGPPQLLQRLVHSQQRQLYGPPQTILRLRPDIRHPAIV